MPRRLLCPEPPAQLEELCCQALDESVSPGRRYARRYREVSDIKWETFVATNLAVSCGNPGAWGYHQYEGDDDHCVGRWLCSSR